MGEVSPITVIAVTGKGGTGKTVFAAMLILRLCRKGYLLAVDADPDSNLPEALGVEEGVEKTLGEVKELFQHTRDEIRGDKEIWFEAKIFEAINELDEFDLIVMGRPEGEGCYCYTNNLLRGILRKFMQHYDYVVVDCEAGLEHFSRKTIDRADCVVVVTDTSRKGLKTAERISSLMCELNLKAKKGLVGNKADERAEEIMREFAEERGFKFLGALPYDEKLAEYDMLGKSVKDLLLEQPDSKFVRAFEEVFEKFKSWCLCV